MAKMLIAKAKVAPKAKAKAAKAKVKPAHLADKGNHSQMKEHHVYLVKEA